MPGTPRRTWLESGAVFLWGIIGICGLSGSEKCGREALEAPTRTSAVRKIIQTPRERK